MSGTSAGPRRERAVKASIYRVVRTLGSRVLPCHPRCHCVRRSTSHRVGSCTRLAWRPHPWRRRLRRGASGSGTGSRAPCRASSPPTINCRALLPRCPGCSPWRGAGDLWVGLGDSTLLRLDAASLQTRLSASMPDRVLAIALSGDAAGISDPRSVHHGSRALACIAPPGDISRSSLERRHPHRDWAAPRRPSADREPEVATRQGHAAHRMAEADSLCSARPAASKRSRSPCDSIEHPDRIVARDQGRRRDVDLNGADHAVARRIDLPTRELGLAFARVSMSHGHPPPCLEPLPDDCCED